MEARAKVDIDGLYIEDVLVDYDFTGVEEIENNEYIIGTSVPQGFFKPKWDFENEEWIEGLSAEEIEELKNVVREKTPLELELEELRRLANPLNPDQIFEQLDVENTDIEELKTKKLDQLNYLCNQEILSGYESSALGGELHQYDFDYDAQINLAGTLNSINASLIDVDIDWKTNLGVKKHSIEQFKVMYMDGMIHKQTLINKYWSKKEQVLALDTKEEIINVVWKN